MQNIKFIIHYLRAIGALSVVYSHWGMMFFLSPQSCSALSFYVDFPRDYIPFLIQATTWKYFNFGMFGVAMFFLISGFLTNISWKDKTIKEFIVKRALRLYPLYAIGLLFTGGVLYLSAHLNGIQFPYTYDVFLKNLSLFRLWFWAPSIDGVNWTMEVDVFFYMGCVALVYFGYKLNDVRIYMALSIIGAITIYLTHDISLEWITNKFYLFKFFYCINFFLSILPIIFIGMILWNDRSQNENCKKDNFLYVLVMYMFFCFDFSILYPEQRQAYYISYGAAVCLFMIAYYLCNRIEMISCRLLEYIADISFPLYIIHGAAGYAALAWLYKHGFGLWTFVIAGVGFLGLAHLMHIMLEEKLERIAKKWLG